MRHIFCEVSFNNFQFNPFVRIRRALDRRGSFFDLNFKTVTLFIMMLNYFTTTLAWSWSWRALGLGR